ncbi:MAG: pantoate--beta-alanine ligase [Candidatus Electryonea clarkiae]|nr:pantoate--beta-alanine ligase [Candidatus Electryonea clarkiae]MDP8288663.1 pantoate--beta-alanine ligase [Candidatus Electryonea clarkiae]
MIIIKSADEMRQWSFDQRSKGNKIGFVPTMGFLHEGHLSLIEIAQKEAEKVVLSIFVNPAQFSPDEDFESYPRDEKRDLRLCREKGVDVVFLPAVNEMYPDNYSTYVIVEGLGDYLCGASRQDHFRGVTTVVTKLFNAVLPSVAVFGQKDAQQGRIIERMTADLQFGINIKIASIVREQDGLAMSSRNVRLLPEHRKQAPAIFHGLGDILKQFNSGTRDSVQLKDTFSSRLQKDAPNAALDYVDVVDWNNLEPVESISSKALIAVAVYLGKVRLIDNIILEQVSAE